MQVLLLLMVFPYIHTLGKKKEKKNIYQNTYLHY